MDNLGSHRSRAVRAAIRATGAKLFLLSKYAPDLNPIEQVFAKLKTCCESVRQKPQGRLRSHRSATRPLHTRRMSAYIKTQTMSLT